MQLRLVAALELPVTIQTKVLRLEHTRLHLSVEYVLQPDVELRVVDLVNELRSRQPLVSLIRLEEVVLFVRAMLENEVIVRWVNQLTLVISDKLLKGQIQFVVDVILEKDFAARKQFIDFFSNNILEWLWIKRFALEDQNDFFFTKGCQ